MSGRKTRTTQSYLSIPTFSPKHTYPVQSPGPADVDLLHVELAVEAARRAFPCRSEDCALCSQWSGYGGKWGMGNGNRKLGRET